jgi:hypothetical protein
LKSLETAVPGRVKLEAFEMKRTEMKVPIQKIRELPMLTVQMINAVKTFALPTLDCMMLNGGVGEKQPKKMDQYIRQSINAGLRVRS